MDALIGQTLSHYRIVEKVGAGGMGEVYRAHDSRLGRDVAIKVLPAHLSATPEVRARFEREARTISQLNHPHICTLYDVGHQDGVDYLVMELVEGETLAQRLHKSPLPTADVLRLGAQIADALDRAHRAGIVHRDLKPGNVMLTKSGAKLMDFGLARTGAPIQEAGRAAESPTMSRPLTAEGMIVGTLQYMAPEQLEGKEADARSDIWALGCVLYEMATGAPAFEGKSKASLIAAIMEHEPPSMAELQPLTPPALQHTVRRCLAKDAGERWQSARDLAQELEWIRGVGSQAGAPAPGTARRRGRERLAWMAAALALAAGSLLGILVGQRIGSTRGAGKGDIRIPRRFDLVLPDSLPMTFVGGSVLAIEERSLALSPRGDVLVYVAEHRGAARLVSVDLTKGTIELLPGTQGASSPFFSPDGNWVGFLTETELKRVATHGASPMTLAQVDEPYGAQWVDAERIVVAERQGSALTFVRSGGGRFDSLKATAGVSPLLTPDRSGLLWSYAHRLSHLDIDTRKMSFLTVRGREHPDSAWPAELLYGYSPFLLASGYLLYVQSGSDGALVGVPVAPGTLRPLAEPIPVATNVRISASGPSVSQFTTSSGVLVYASDTGFGFRHFIRRRRDGIVDSLPFRPAEYGNFEVSPEGSRIAVVIWPPSGQTELWIYDLVRGDRERVCDAEMILAWTADGNGLVYSTTRTRDAPPVTLRRHLDGSGRVDTLARRVIAAVSRDGRWGVLPARGGGRLTRRDGAGPDSIFIPNLLGDLSAFSPDSRWLAGTYWEAGRSEVYISPVDHPTGRIRISTAGGEEPRWSADGRRIIYRYRRDWYEASLRPGSPPTVRSPGKLFAGPYVNVPGYSHDVFPDGSHLVLQGSGNERTNRLHVVTNLDALLRSGEHVTGSPGEHGRQ
jgi:Tol biopolymer transport system component/Ser/Thr protein kinase RdoA (MazF antagonist)